MTLHAPETIPLDALQALDALSLPVVQTVLAEREPTSYARISVYLTRGPRPLSEERIVKGLEAALAAGLLVEHGQRRIGDGPRYWLGPKLTGATQSDGLAPSNEQEANR